jgi:DNA-binding response OmpR family regulator
LKRTVLSIEDTPGIRRLIRMTLEYDGFEVIEAADGREGLELARSKRPDLILMDVRMPGMSGVEACKALSADSYLSKIPVVMLTSADASEDMQAGLDAGARAYLTKPFEPIALIELVHELIDEATGH